LLKTVSTQLELDLGSKQLQRLTEAPVGAARDALFKQRRETVVLIRDSLSKVKDEVRRKSEIIERSESNLIQLRSVSVALSTRIHEARGCLGRHFKGCDSAMRYVYIL